MSSPLAANPPLYSGRMLLFMAAHAPLALALARSSMLSTLHTVATAIACVAVALTAKTTRAPAYAIAYVAGIETLWRMTGARIPWETGKYLCILIALLAILRKVKGERQPSVNLPVLYLALLLPSLLKLLGSFDMTEMKEAISFNLSGPAALAVLAIFFSRCVFDIRETARLLAFFWAPLLGVSTLAYFSLRSSGRAAYSDFESSFAAAGGYGPNQVAALLGLGALCGVLLYLALRPHRQLRRGWVPWLLLLGAAGLTVQATLTLSRGGVWALGVALACAFVLMFKETRTRLTVLIAAPLIYLLAVYLVIPVLDDFTGGRLVYRYTEKSAGGRDWIAQSDMDLWQQDFFLGGGPGSGKRYRELAYGHGSAAHTEFTRLVGEHGVAGICALLALGAASFVGIGRARSPMERGTIVAFSAWAFLFMLGNAMRLVLPGFVFALGAAGYDFEREGQAASGKR